MVRALEKADAMLTLSSAL